MYQVVSFNKFSTDDHAFIGMTMEDIDTVTDVSDGKIYSKDDIVYVTLSEHSSIYMAEEKAIELINFIGDWYVSNK